MKKLRSDFIVLPWSGVTLVVVIIGIDMKCNFKGKCINFRRASFKGRREAKISRVARKLGTWERLGVIPAPTAFKWLHSVVKFYFKRKN